MDIWINLLQAFMLGLLMHTNIIFKNITVLNEIVSCIRTHRCHERETYCFFCIAVIEINPDTLRMFNYFSHLKIKQKWKFQNTRNPNLKLYQLEKHYFIDNISFINPFIHFMSGNWSIYASSKAIETWH